MLVDETVINDSQSIIQTDLFFVLISSCSCSLSSDDDDDDDNSSTSELAEFRSSPLFVFQRLGLATTASSNDIGRSLLHAFLVLLPFQKNSVRRRMDSLAALY